VTTWQEPAELKEVREKKAAAEPAVDDVAAAVVAPVATNLASAQAKADAAAGVISMMGLLMLTLTTIALICFEILFVALSI
jgi:hypothetical protein